jgi:hypothetical protein
MLKRPRPPIWLWFNLLSLDAPLIALVWQDFLARCYPTVLHPIGRCVLGLTVWAVYLADRLLDVRRPASGLEPVRHRFYRQHRGFVQTLLGLILSVDIVVTRLWLRPAVFDNGLLLTGGVIAYLAAFPLTGWGATAWKKPLAAFLFTAGTFLIAWTTAGHPADQLVWPAAAFGALCLGNLRQGANLHGWVWLLLLAAGVAFTRSSSWAGAIVASAVGLTALSRWSRGISGDARAVLADALLLTPLLFR